MKWEDIVIKQEKEIKFKLNVSGLNLYAVESNFNHECYEEMKTRESSGIHGKTRETVTWSK